MAGQLGLEIGIMGGLLAVTAYYVIAARDLVYASVALALLGSLNAALIALLGYPIVAAFVVIVYVGAAVMFIIITISMLGGGGQEKREEFRGMFTSLALASTAFTVAVLSGIYLAYKPPNTYSISQISQVLAGRYLPALGVVFIALAATLVEAITIARRAE
ncbi:MAG: NADH-quinone oxidoreductase subunit J [Desulfurococcales archaeon]|nr:NADH-quinone oxidoreductase subunit J [Desulfurococcales archaeon]